MPDEPPATEPTLHEGTPEGVHEAPSSLPQPPMSGDPDVRGEPGGATPGKDARNWAVLAHLSAFLGLVLPFAGNIIGPLVVWLVKREEDPFVEDQAREALNFQISLTIYGIIAGILVILLVGILLLALVAIAGFVLVLLAALRASEGKRYRYPLTLRFIQ